MDVDYTAKLNEYLGYGRTLNGMIATLATDSPSLFLTVQDYIDQLIAIDAKLTAATSDSMATEVGDLSVDYTAHVQHLRSEGSRIVNLIASLVEVPVNYDRYIQRKPTQSSRLSIESYW